MVSLISITTESGGRQNLFPTEVKAQLIEGYTNYQAVAEKVNGSWAMLGSIFLVLSYPITGQIIPGVL
tara:strand:- start:1268 stop:1471 length:204 start_codon:yes stop_codon:yes gene_type:complete